MKRLLSLVQGRQDMLLIGLLMVTIMVMIVPLPTIFVDMLLAFNIGFTLLVLVVSIYLKRPEDFSSFPAIILLATTFRLAISISTTRLILSDGDAGAVIDTFGNFVTRGSVLVGLVVFLIITTVQFIVITKGAERVAEVAARFNLDGLPGRQMSIDAELRNGDIDAAGAQRKRAQLEKENQFFGAMDGAMKFVKGDAIAGLIIVAINLIGGLIAGVMVQGMPIEAALNLYSRLTVGDGLVGQIPALIVAMCAGTIITRVNTGSNNDLGTDIITQLTSGPKALYITGALVASMSIVPGLPTFIFLALGALLGGIGFLLDRKSEAEGDADGPSRPRAGLLAGTGASATGRQGSATMAAILAEPGSIVTISLGSRAFEAMEPAKFGELRKRELDALETRTGVRLPSFGIEPMQDGEPEEVAFVLDGVRGFSAMLSENRMVAICDPSLLEINSIAPEPLESGWPLRSAYWIDRKAAAPLQAAGVEVMDTTQLVVHAAVRFLQQNAPRILGYRQVQQIVRELGAEHEQLASQISQSISAVQLLGLFRRLLWEGVPLRPRRILFEALLEGSVSAAGPEHLVRFARAALCRQICAIHADENGLIAGYVVEPALDVAMRESLVRGNDETLLKLRPDIAAALLDEASTAFGKRELGSAAPVVLTSEELRWPLATFLRNHSLEAQVMSFNEITGEFTFAPVGTLGARMNAAYDGGMAA